MACPAGEASFEEPSRARLERCSSVQLLHGKAWKGRSAANDMAVYHYDSRANCRTKGCVVAAISIRGEHLELALPDAAC